MFSLDRKVLIPHLPKINKTIFDATGSSKWDVWKAAGRQACVDSPSISNFFDPENLRYLSDPEFADIQQLGASGYFDKPRITREEFEAKYGNTRLKYDPNFTTDKIEDILSRDKQREINEYIISRGKGGLVEAVGKFGVEVIAGNLSPINIAASFVPVGKAAWWAASALKYGALKTTLAKGFVSGVVGQAAIEPFLYKERNFEHREYGIKDSFINIVQSGMFGSALHGLGYGTKILRDKYFITPEKLTDNIKTNHPIVDNEFKESIISVLNETDPRELITDLGKSNNNIIISDIAGLQRSKIELINKAELQFPDYFEQYKKTAELDQSLHEQYYTKNDDRAIPRHLYLLLEQEKSKLQAMREEYISNIEFQEYLNKSLELDNQIKTILRKEQFETKAYNLLFEDLYLARSQLNEGKHINLSEPQNAESIFSVNTKNNINTKNTEPVTIAEQMASLEQDIANLSENYKAEYAKSLEAEQEIETVFAGVIDRLRKAKTEKDIAGSVNLLSLVDAELAGELKSFHKKYVGQIKLDSLERNKQIDMFISDFKDKQFLRKRDKALNLINLSKAENFVRRFKNKVTGISEKLKQSELWQIAVEREVLFGLVRELEEAGLTSMFRDSNFEEAIAQELWNITHPNKIESGSIHAKNIAEIVHKHRTAAINRANLAGSHIIPLEGYITKRFHNSKKLRSAGFNKWFEFIDPLLDKERTGEADFRKIFNNLATEIHLKEADEYLNLPTAGSSNKDIANMVSASQKLHFKDAASELKYLREFGNYSKPNLVDKVLNPIIPEKSFLAESIISDFSRLSRSIGILESLGSKPQETLNSLRHTFIRELQEKAVVNTEFFSELSSLQRSSKFDSRLDLMLGISPEVPQVNKILDFYRAFKCMTSLGSTIISSIPDAMTFVAELQNNAIPLLDSYSNIFKVFTNSKENKEVARQLGIGIDSLLGNVYTRLSSESSIAGGMSKLTDAFFKLNFMQWWDDAWKSSVGNILSHNLVMNTGKAFDNLDQRLKVLLERYSINESNWYLYKYLAKEVAGNKYLIPDVNLLPDLAIDQHLRMQSKSVNDLNRIRLKQEITNNLQRYLIDRVDTAIPTAHTHEQSVMQLAGLGIKPGTPIAEVIKCLMQFKTFAYTYVARPLKAITLDQIPVHEQQGFGTFDKGTWKDIATSLQNPTTLKTLTQLLLGTTTLGYLSLNAARMLKGESPLAPNSKEVFMASVLKGGGLGLYGDFIFGEYDRYRHNLLESLAGPIGGDLIDIGKIYSKARNGDPDAIDLTTNLFKRNIPGRNLFYLMPALFMVENHLK